MEVNFRLSGTFLKHTRNSMFMLIKVMLVVPVFVVLAFQSKSSFNKNICLCIFSQHKINITHH